MKRFAILSLFAVTVLALGATLAMAQNNSPYIGGNGCGGWGGYWGYNTLYGSRVNDVPYYSMFPPVYYSSPVPRTYGWSPFAYPPGTLTPAVAKEEPQTLINPHVPQSSDKDTKPTSTTRTAGYRQPQPQVLLNPFCKPNST